MAYEWVGYLGALLLIAAWIPETYKIYKTKSAAGIEPLFLLIYLMSTGLMTIYSYLIDAVPFMLSGVVVFLLSLFEAGIFLKYRKTKRKL